MSASSSSSSNVLPTKEQKRGQILFSLFQKGVTEQSDNFRVVLVCELLIAIIPLSSRVLKFGFVGVEALITVLISRGEASQGGDYHNTKKVKPRRHFFDLTIHFFVSFGKRSRSGDD